MRRLKFTARRMLGDQEGVTIIEFAVVFPIFLMFFFGLFESSMMMFGNNLIQNMMDQSVRLGVVGCQRNEFATGNCHGDYSVDPVQIRREITRKSFGLINACDKDRFTISVAPVGSPEADDPDSGIVNLGQGDEVMVYYVKYEWRVFTPYLQIRSIFGDIINYQYSAVVRNERFGYMGDSRIRTDGGCEQNAT